MGFTAPERGGQPLDPAALHPGGCGVSGVVERYPAGHQVPAHRHPHGHLIYATEGVLLVQASTGQWLVPPTTAVWLRPAVEHSLRATTAVSAYGLFISEALAAQLSPHDCVLHITPLVRELIAAVVGVPPQERSLRRSALLGELVVEELKALAPLPLHLPWPQDPLMRQVCEALVREPACALNADAIASRHALTAKTLHRRFRQATGMNLGKWRQQMRLMASIPQLMQGMAITRVALDSGYESHSAYSVAFKKNFGSPPSAFGGASRGGGAGPRPE